MGRYQIPVRQYKKTQVGKTRSIDSQCVKTKGAVEQKGFDMGKKQKE